MRGRTCRGMWSIGTKTESVRIEYKVLSSKTIVPRISDTIGAHIEAIQNTRPIEKQNIMIRRKLVGDTRKSLMRLTIG